MSGLVLGAPLDGWAMPLDEVPDPVFAGRLLGDGVAIDPVGSTLRAPCDGVVVSVHAGRHAVTLRTAEGAELLMHVGIDTVALAGRGFTTFVVEGQAVRRGDTLLTFDLAVLLDGAPAVATPLLLTNDDAFAIVARETGRAVRAGDPLLTIVRRAEVPAAASATDGAACRRTVVVPLAHGLHARPAARIGACAHQFRAAVVLHRGERQAPAGSVVGLLALGARHGDTLDLVATGEEAAAAVDAVAALIEGGMGERGTPEPPAPAPTPPPGGGVTAAAGLALGRTRWLRVEDIAVADDAEDPSAERARLEAAIGVVRARLAAPAHDPAAGAIQAAHRALLDDPALDAAARAAIGNGRSAGRAWRDALRSAADTLRATGDARLSERADDLLDLERQVLRALAGEGAAAAVRWPAGTILLADDLLPSHLIGVAPGEIAGIATTRGGPTSHVAILAAGLGIPAVVAMGAALDGIGDDRLVLLDADAATLTVLDDAAAADAARARIAARTAARDGARARAAEPAMTRDGVAIEVFANLGSAAEAPGAVAAGAEGCGLLRTEFLFLDRDEAPDEAAQAGSYQAIADALDGRPLIVRLLDIGGDKPAPYLPIAREENPALGLRGIRVGLAHPELLATQLRAILRVRPVGQCRIMVPMVASVAELEAVRTALDRARAALGIVQPVALGVMIETPAAAVTADLIAAQADFLSIGSNDLTQYTLAMDRGNAAVAAGVDGLHPAVLRMIDQACRGAARHRRWVGVCGGLASDPLAVPILIGLGVTELSAVPALVPEVKAAVRAVSRNACRTLAARALDCTSATEVRALASAFTGSVAP